MESSPAVALGLRFAFFVTPENVGSSHFPSRPPKIVMLPSVGFFFFKYTKDHFCCQPKEYQMAKFRI